MNVLVTGGSGTIGKYIVAKLIKHHLVGVLDIKEPDAPSCHFHWVDMINLEALKKVFLNYDAVVHLEGIPHPLNNTPEKVYSTNVLETFNVMEAASNSGVKKVILASSESKTLIQQLYPSVFKFAPDYSSKQSLILSAKANRMLRYTSVYTHSDLFDQINQQGT